MSARRGSGPVPTFLLGHAAMPECGHFSGEITRRSCQRYLWQRAKHEPTLQSPTRVLVWNDAHRRYARRIPVSLAVLRRLHFGRSVSTSFGHDSPCRTRNIAFILVRPAVVFSDMCIFFRLCFEGHEALASHETALRTLIGLKDHVYAPLIASAVNASPCAWYGVPKVCDRCLYFSAAARHSHICAIFRP